MNDNNITVKDLAKQYNVSEQAIRQFCKKHNIRKEIVHTKQGKRETYCFDENALKLIENHYSEESKATQASTTETSNESNITQLLLDSLREQIRTLTAQLDTKDRQIEEQNKQIAELHRLLDQEQQLHQSAQNKIPSAEKNNKVIEAHTTAPAPAEQSPAQTAQERKAERERKAFSQQYGYSSSQYKNLPRKKGTYQASKLFGWMKKRS